MTGKCATAPSRGGRSGWIFSPTGWATPSVPLSTPDGDCWSPVRRWRTARAPTTANPMPAKNPIRPADTMGLDADASSGKASSPSITPSLSSSSSTMLASPSLSASSKHDVALTEPSPSVVANRTRGLIDGGCDRDKEPLLCWNACILARGRLVCSQRTCRR